MEAFAVDDTATIRAIVRAVPRLPAMPAMFHELRRMTADPGTGVHEIALTIQQDPAIAAKVLQLANSPMFKRGATTASLATAVMRLGGPLIARLVLVESVLAMHLPIARFKFAEEARKYFVASLIAEATVSPRVRDEASLAVVLCPIGRLVMIAAAPDTMEQVMLRAGDDALRTITEEIRLFGATHAEVGAYLIESWNLPVRVADAVAMQYSGTSGNEITASVLLANRDVRGIAVTQSSLAGFAAAWDRQRARAAFVEG